MGTPYGALKISFAPNFSDGKKCIEPRLNRNSSLVKSLLRRGISDTPISLEWRFSEIGRENTRSLELMESFECSRQPM